MYNPYESFPKPVIDPLEAINAEMENMIGGGNTGNDPYLMAVKEALGESPKPTMQEVVAYCDRKTNQLLVEFSKIKNLRQNAVSLIAQGRAKQHQNNQPK